MRLLVLASLAVLLTACNRETPAPAAQPAPAPSAPTGPVDATYLCDGGNRVDLVDDRRSARIAMSDGRVVELGGIANSSPRTWADVGLRFVVGDDYVELSQNRGQTLRCEEQTPPDPGVVDPDSATG